ncbi:MAG: hypothetical protein K8R74_15980 [Bacteroidales bacterium]|nr:hypothetical protein [Bacteroidales bacterium]
MQVNVKLKLEEGPKYPFKITGIIDLPDGNECFVLKDPNNVRHLLLTRYFENFNFQLGQTIQCKVDKINCSGKIYLEPEHPYYKLGHNFEFPFQFIEDYKDNVGNLHQFAIFLDVFNNEIKMPVDVLPEKISSGVPVKFAISRIKKGRVYLSSNELKVDYNHFEKGRYYYFRIIQFRLYPDNRSFYILKDEKGFTYKLRSKYFEKYDFRIGQSIQCRLVREEKEIFIEPKHPYYALGYEYDFDIIKEELIDDYPSGKIKAYLIKNDYGKAVHIPKKHVKGKIINGKLKCIVSDIRKSRLYLDC